ncbi:hypothetical protein [Rubritalea marina]|uniref:hypothetical protein n=1 Tax=Rubritalea marina TaxID=361055 RepID=UPI0012EA7EE6|nr:hypothetical protein [Rubritalea marina]
MAQHRTSRTVGIFSLLCMALLSSCVVQRTVTDSTGKVIYQEPEVHTPWESDEKVRQEVLEKQRELGYN